MTTGYTELEIFFLTLGICKYFNLLINHFHSFEEAKMLVGVFTLPLRNKTANQLLKVCLACSSLVHPSRVHLLGINAQCQCFVGIPQELEEY